MILLSRAFVVIVIDDIVDIVDVVIDVVVVDDYFAFVVIVSGQHLSVCCYCHS